MGSMLPDLQEHPGLLYVAATLLPLASFLLLLLAGFLKNAARPRAGQPTGGALFQLLGGNQPGRGAAYVATAAMALAFVLCAVGFYLYSADYERSVAHSGHAAEAVEAEGPHGHADTAPPSLEEQHRREQFEGRWSGQLRWAVVNPAGTRTAGPGTVLTLGYRIDHLSAVMFLMVTLIATLIHIFSIGYMADELAPVVEDHHVHVNGGHLHRRGRFGRFFLFLSLFSFSMLNLILADNFFQIFVSWELVGVCSYLLIGFYYERQSASNAANKAFIVNRVGDAGFILGLLILWTTVGTFNFQEIFHRVRAPVRDSDGKALALAGQVVRAEPVEGSDGRQLRVGQPGSGSQVVLFPKAAAKRFHGPAPGDVIDVGAAAPGGGSYGSMPYWLLVVAGLGIFLGCVGKSAQFPLHVWLPDAMEGPTPVSALIHAATMVAAGVYLVGRCFPLFVPESRLVIAYVGGITLFMAATVALVMTDIKKVLAYSTVSQLGYMMLALGVGGWVAGLFHLITHAFFKALLFLCSGSVIHGCHHEQDMMRMGGLLPKMRVTATTMLVGVLTIAGIPLFSGWYSKDAILAHAFGFAWVHPEHGLLFLLPLVTAGLTAFYMFRMWFLTFAGKPRNAHVYEHAHESPSVMTLPLVILACFSVVVAWGWPVYDAQKSYLESRLHLSQHESVIADFGYLPDIDHSWVGGLAKAADQSERHFAHAYHDLAGGMTLGVGFLGIVFAWLLYYRRELNPDEAGRQFPAVYRFLWNKWYFDEVYSAALVHPAVVVARWCRSFDLSVIDGVINRLGSATVGLARGEGRFDLGIVDGLVNLTANVTYAVGARLRAVQTGYIRSYVLFLVLAAIGLFAVLSYFVAMAVAG